MTSRYDAKARERRRAWRLVPFTILVVGFTVSVSRGADVVYWICGDIGLLLVVFATIDAVLWRARTKTFRVDGQLRQGWPANVPLTFVRGARSSHGGDQTGEIYGHLFVLPDELVWMARKPHREFGAPELRWDRAWHLRTDPIWGPAQQGHLILSHPDGCETHLWVWWRKSLASAILDRSA